MFTLSSFVKITEVGHIFWDSQSFFPQYVKVTHLNRQKMGWATFRAIFFTNSSEGSF
jgi:hypothetical protein